MSDLASTSNAPVAISGAMKAGVPVVVFSPVIFESIPWSLSNLTSPKSSTLLEALQDPAALLSVAAAEQFRPDQLDRREPGQHVVLGEPDFAHPPGADPLDEFVHARDAGVDVARSVLAGDEDRRDGDGGARSQSRQDAGDRPGRRDADENGRVLGMTEPEEQRERQRHRRRRRDDDRAAAERRWDEDPVDDGEEDVLEDRAVPMREGQRRVARLDGRKGPSIGSDREVGRRRSENGEFENAQTPQGERRTTEENDGRDPGNEGHGDLGERVSPAAESVARREGAHRKKEDRRQHAELHPQKHPGRERVHARTGHVA